MEEVKIGVYVCHCGLNIAGTVDVEEVAKYAGTLPHVVISRDYRYMCSDPGQDLIKNDIEELGLNRVVVASCSPRMHEPTFRGAVQDAGLNPYLCEHISIREQCSWLSTDKEKNTEKAKDIVRAPPVSTTFWITFKIICLSTIWVNNALSMTAAPGIRCKKGSVLIPR